ncbi:hypothetical protein QBC37DRAFT_465307 [Rhypophila decipiens]|uniref:C2H2-type domain-containing protein n=1 Tax=Rhypophila decipiens TaxID=261697 RepID=A0AAN6Y690_9PEZI|nr:hypothetical protein QBC37DRAFT_465307 [Rhypophila decipiens]
MIPFRPRVADQSNPSSQTNESMEPQKPLIENDNLLERVPPDDGHDSSDDASQVLISLGPLNDDAYGTRPAPPAPPSEAVPSSGGKSLSCPTENDIHDDNEMKERMKEDLLHMLFDHDNYNQDVRLRPLELQLASEDLEPNEGESGPLPWKFEFSWQSETLLFDGNTFSTRQSTGSPSDGSGAVVGGSSLASATGHTVQESMLSTGTTNTSSLELVCFLEGEIQRSMMERRQLLIDILEQHYFRAHPPQRSGGRKSSNRHSVIDTSSRPSSSKEHSRSMTVRRIAGTIRGKGITGNGNGGDEEDEEDGEPSEVTPQPSLNLDAAGPYYACPYLKWKPQKYNKCVLRFRTISHMIGHLEDRHFANRCPTCWISFATPNEMKMHRQKSCYGAAFAHPSSLEPDEITDEQWVQIKKRPERKYQSPESRWHHIFKILFPQSPPPRSVYCEGKHMNEVMDGLITYFQREGAKVLADLQDELSREDRRDHVLSSESRDEQSRAVLEGFISQAFTRISQAFPRIVSRYMSDEDSATEYCRQNDQNGRSESQVQAAGFTPVDRDSKTSAAKGKSVRFVEPNMDAYLFTLTEEETPTSTTQSSTSQSHHSSETSSFIPAEPPVDPKLPDGCDPDEYFAHFTMAGDYNTAEDTQMPIQARIPS